MQKYVISLENALDRREHIETEFAKHGVSYKFFDAITPQVARNLAKDKELSISEEFLTEGELACLMSHVMLWYKMINENIPTMAIFEDDIYLGSDANYYLNNKDWCIKNFDLIKIEAFLDKIFVSHITYRLPVGNRKLFKLKGPNLGTAGYIISKQGAEKLISFIQKGNLIAIDRLIFDKFVSDETNEVFQFEPALCIQEMLLFPETNKNKLDSNLVKERQLRMKKFKKRGKQKIIHEFLRILEQLKYTFFGKKVFFK